MKVTYYAYLMQLAEVFYVLAVDTTDILIKDVYYKTYSNIIEVAKRLTVESASKLFY